MQKILVEINLILSDRELFKNIGLIACTFSINFKQLLGAVHKLRSENEFRFFV